jgi:rsbT co-antagonist protein RsbR
MSDELEQYKKEVEAQKDTLLSLFSEIGLYANYDFDIEFPEDTPLAELFVGIKIAADNLGVMASQLEHRVKEAEEATKLVKAQSETILELSTPVIGIWDEILILPLIGTVDTRRAQQVVESLLESIVQTQASVAIIDITGVPVVDTKVANHLINTMEAAKMLGADTILTGVSPHNAQTLVKLGVELSKIITKSSLQAGLKTAFEMTKNKVVKDD